jgi:hypothetical protein
MFEAAAATAADEVEAVACKEWPVGGDSCAWAPCTKLLGGGCDLDVGDRDTTMALSAADTSVGWVTVIGCAIGAMA